VTSAVPAIGARIPLRIRLVAALVVLGALALAAMGFAATTAIRTYLLSRVDAQLVAVADQVRQVGLRPDQPTPGGDEPLPTTFFVALAQADGRLYVSRDRLMRDEHDVPNLRRIDFGELASRGLAPSTVSSQGRGGHDWRVLAVPVGNGSAVVVGLSLEDVDRTVARLNTINVVVGLVVLALLGIGGYLVVRSSLRPLVEVEHTAEAIAAGDLSRRVPAGDPRTEIGRLARSLNGMLGQIESAFRAREASETSARRSEERMRQFVADASHELRTPLASVRGFAELYRQGAVPTDAEVARVMRRIEDEAVRMGILVEDLLLLARVDEQRPLEYAPVDLLTIAGDAVHDARAVAPDRRIEFEPLPSGVPPIVSGDDARLRQVAANLVSNAVTHTPPEATVRVRVGTQDGWALLEVTDDGPGLAPEEAARVFERFYRADPSRTRASGGSGLGLSIVAALVAAHGGTVEVDSAPGRGATFRVRLPRSA
jgi:two-component system OmpR family sensor kinase